MNKYEVGQTYVTNSLLYARKKPNGDKVLLKNAPFQLKTNGTADENGLLIIGKNTKIKCADVAVVEDQIWLKVGYVYVLAQEKKDGNEIVYIK